MTGDWIKLHRKLLEHPIMAHDGLCRMWIYCLMRANWKKRRWLMPGTTTPIVIPRGSFITGRKALHEALYPKDDNREMPTPSPSTVWRWLHSLQTMQCVKLENVNNRCTMVSICNYSTYQDDKRKREQPVNSRRTTGEQLLDTDKEGKNFKNDSSDSRESSNPSVWDEDFCQCVLGDAHAISQTFHTTSRDRIACCKAAYLVHAKRLPTAWLATSLSEAQRQDANVPHAMFYKVMKNLAVSFGVLDFDAEWKAITIPKAIWKQIRSTEVQLDSGS